MIEFRNYDEEVVDTVTGDVIPRKGEQVWLKDDQRYTVDQVIYIARGTLLSNGAPHARIYIELIDEETTKSDNATVPYDNHVLDFDQNSNWFLIPTQQLPHFERWMEDNKLNYHPEAEDLLPGMIPVEDPTNVVITDYVFVTSNKYSP